MTKAARYDVFPLHQAHQEQTAPAVRPRVRVGPYVYAPAPAWSPHMSAGTLSRNGLPVTLATTESVLLDFLDRMSALEADLARRWSASASRPHLSRAE